jgi:5,10-methenyltetrahydrofolate synthetase
VVESIARKGAPPDDETAMRPPQKATLRAKLLAAREQLADAPEHAETDRRLAERLMAALDEFAPRCIGFFWPVAAEFDARDAIAGWLAADPAHHAALPVVVDPRGPMVYHAWTPDAPMKEGRYRIPVPAREHVVVPDLLLAPCVGFDAARYRLGYGGGYFDRTLAAWPTHAKRPITIGVAYECTRVDGLPREAHDVPLDAIVTEAARY